MSRRIEYSSFGLGLRGILTPAYAMRPVDNTEGLSDAALVARAIARKNGKRVLSLRPDAAMLGVDDDGIYRDTDGNAVAAHYHVVLGHRVGNGLAQLDAAFWIILSTPEKA